MRDEDGQLDAAPGHGLPNLPWQASRHACALTRWAGARRPARMKSVTGGPQPKPSIPVHSLPTVDSLLSANWRCWFAQLVASLTLVLLA